MLPYTLKALLTHHGLVTAGQIRAAVVATLGTRTTWLEDLVFSRQLDEDVVAHAAGAEAGVPLCELARLAKVPLDVLALMPRDLAVEHRMVPLWLESNGDLCVAMADPFDVVAVREVEFFTGRHVLRELAPATPMAWALTTYYGAQCALWPPRGSRLTHPRNLVRLARGSVPPPIVERFDGGDDLDAHTPSISDSIELEWAFDALPIPEVNDDSPTLRYDRAAAT